MQIIKLEDVIHEKKKIISWIKEGRIFVYPTDTVYGIGCNALNVKSVLRIRMIKGTQHPFSVIAPSRKWIEENFEIRFPEYVDMLPGKITLILKQKNRVIPHEVSKSENVGVRIPAHPFTGIIQESGVPFVTTSANISGEKTITEISELPERIREGIDVAVDGGKLGLKASKIIDLTGEEPRVVRE